MKIYRILGRDGSATIPFALRKELDFRPGDVVCFERMGEGVLVRKEKILEITGYEQHLQLSGGISGGLVCQGSV